MNKKLIPLFAYVFALPLLVQAACKTPQPFDETHVSVVDTSFNVGQSEGAAFVTTIGSIRNTSDALIEDIVVEVKYFNKEKKLIDVVTQSIYGLVVPASQDVAFRIRDVADQPKASYASSTVRVISANQRVTQQPQQTAASNYWIELVTGWAPVVLFLAVFIYLVRKTTGKNSPQARTVGLIEKQTDALNRIAVATEKASSDQ